MEQLQAEAREGLAELIVENLGEALLVFEGGTKKALFFNRAAAVLVGHAGPATAGMKCHEIFCRRDVPCDPGERACLLDEAVSSGVTVRQPHRFFTTDGKPGTADMVATPLPGRGASRNRIVISVRDITESTTRTREVMQHIRDIEESSRLKALLTDIVGHDILNPASVIRYSVDMLRESETDRRRQVLWEMLERSLSLIIKIVENVSLYSKLERADEIEYSPMDIASVMETVISNLARECQEKSLEVSFSRRGECPAMANPMMEDVFMNILSNAARHTPRGGRICVGIEDGGDRWIVSVRDSGGGVPDEAKESIFERFTSLEANGLQGRLGLGLSIARRIMDLHGGSIQVADAPGQGADFRVSIMKSGPAGPSRSHP